MEVNFKIYKLLLFLLLIIMSCGDAENAYRVEISIPQMRSTDFYTLVISKAKDGQYSKDAFFIKNYLTSSFTNITTEPPRNTDVICRVSVYNTATEERVSNIINLRVFYNDKLVDDQTVNDEIITGGFVRTD